MDDCCFATLGTTIYPGRVVKILCLKDSDDIGEKTVPNRYRIIYVKNGRGVFHNGDNSQIVTSPAVLCLNETDSVFFSDTSELKLDIMYCDPSVFERYNNYKDIADWKSQLTDDIRYFFEPFFERSDSYIGASTTNHYHGNRISQLIDLADTELQIQRDEFWPCRSRSYFIELLLLVSSVFREEKQRDQIFVGKMTDEIREVVDYLHIHYLEKIVIEDITKQFNTNKTTLNQKFKAVMGITVMAYIISLRMQIACSLLRKTYLSVREIMERSGYRDDAHFLRAFKKYAGCTPTEYRSRYEVA